MKTPVQLIEDIVDESTHFRLNSNIDLERILQDYTEDVIDFACEWLKVATQCGVHPCSSNSFVEDFRKAMGEPLWESLITK